MVVYLTNGNNVIVNYLEFIEVYRSSQSPRDIKLNNIVLGIIAYIIVYIIMATREQRYDNQELNIPDDLPALESDDSDMSDSSDVDDTNDTNDVNESPTVSKPVFNPEDWAGDYGDGDDNDIDNMLDENTNMDIPTPHSPSIMHQLNEIGQLQLSPNDMLRALLMWAAVRAHEEDNDEDENAIDNINNTTENSE